MFTIYNQKLIIKYWLTVYITDAFLFLWEVRQTHDVQLNIMAVNIKCLIFIMH